MKDINHEISDPGIDNIRSEEMMAEVIEIIGDEPTKTPHVHTAKYSPK